MGVDLTKSLRTEIVKAFCKRLEEYGWYIGITVMYITIKTNGIKKY
ncbi:hypothetical protein ABGF48_06740 [Helcococcus bovis]